MVTATKRETSLMATPLAVTALTQNMLNRDGVSDMRDLGSLVPNLQVGHSPSDSGVQVTVRGITSNNFTEIGDPSIGIHVDGMYSPRPQGGLALLHDVERVEILRGPQGTLFGRNSTSGTINIITARPDFAEFYGNVEVEYGRYDHKLVRGFFNVPITGTLAARASYMLDYTDSYITQVNDTYDLAVDSNFDGDFDDPTDVPADGIPNVDQRRARQNIDDADAYGNSKRWAFRLNFLWEPAPEFSWLFGYDHFQDNGAGLVQLKDCEKAAGTFFACDEPQWFVRSNVPGSTDMTIGTWRSHITWEAPNQMLFEYRVAYAKQEREQYHDGAIVYADRDHPAWGLNRPNPNNLAPLVRNVEQIMALGYDQATIDRLEAAGFITRDTDTGALTHEPPVIQPWDDLSLITRWSDYESLVNEFQIKSNSPGPLQWIVGIFDLREDNAIRFDVENPFCCVAVRPLALSFVQPKREVTSTAVFAQVDYALSDRFNLTVGYRYTQDEKSDSRGANHETIGYWVNANLYQDPDQPNFPLNDQGAPDFFWHEGYGLIGEATDWTGYYQADDLLPYDGTLGPNFLTRVPGTDNSFEQDWSSSTWKVGADWTVNDDLFIYGYVATGFKAGGFGDAIDTNGAEPGGMTFGVYEPEDVITYELGAKMSLLDGQLNLIANVFFNDYTDLQRTTFATVGEERICSVGTLMVPDSGAVSCVDENGDPAMGMNADGDPVPAIITERDVGTLLTTNVAEAEIFGIEFEFDWWGLWEGGHIFGWIAYLDAEIVDLPGIEDGLFCYERALLDLTTCPDEDPNQPREGGGFRRPANFNGNRLPWSPEWSLTVNIEHNWYFNNGLRLSPYLSVNWTDEIFFSDNNFDEGPYHTGRDALTTVNASLRLINEEGGWGAELYVYNWTDELVRNWSDTGPGFQRSSFAPPRSYGIKLRRDF